jgi:putative flippase GtrA
VSPVRRARSALPSASFLRFFSGSAVGLAIDLGGYSLLVAGGLAPGAANVVSAFLSITAVYLLVTRYAFAVDATPRTYALFVTWYGTSILVFSAVIEWAADATSWPPLLCKLGTVPVSFVLNYWFSRRILTRSRTRAEPA